MKGLALREFKYFKPYIIFSVIFMFITGFLRSPRLNSYSTYFSTVYVLSTLLIMCVFAQNTDHLQFYSSVAVTKKQIVTARIISAVIFELGTILFAFVIFYASGWLHYALMKLTFDSGSFIVLPTKLTFTQTIDLIFEQLIRYAWFNFVFFSLIYRKNRNGGGLEWAIAVLGPFVFAAVLMLLSTIIAGVIRIVGHGSFTTIWSMNNGKFILFNHDFTDFLTKLEKISNSTPWKIFGSIVTVLIYCGATVGAMFIGRKKLNKVTI